MYEIQPFTILMLWSWRPLLRSHVVAGIFVFLSLILSLDYNLYFNVFHIIHLVTTINFMWPYTDYSIHCSTYI